MVYEIIYMENLYFSFFCKEINNVDICIPSLWARKGCGNGRASRGSYSGLGWEKKGVIESRELLLGLDKMLQKTFE